MVFTSDHGVMCPFKKVHHLFESGSRFLQALKIHFNVQNVVIFCVAVVLLSRVPFSKEYGSSQRMVFLEKCVRRLYTRFTK